MVAPNRHNGGAQFLVLLAAAICLSIASAAPSLVDLKRKRDEAKKRLFSTTTTTPAPPSKALKCEEKFENAEKFSYNETSLHVDIKNLMNTYHNWGELLAPAPAAISTLGQLIIMSTQIKDFPIDINLPADGFKHIKYPKSFRTTLLQISHDGYLAFLKAHTNMDKIRMYNSNVPSHIKDATRYLMSRNEDYILDLLPISLGRIKEAADQSKQLSIEVKEEFEAVVQLIQETNLAVSDTKSEKEVKLDEVKFNITLSKIEHEFSKNETKLLKEKNEMLSGMLNSFGTRQKNIFIRTIYGNEDFVINLSNPEWLLQTEGRHEKHRDIFFDRSDWRYNNTDECVENDKCVEKNYQHLLDLIIVMAQYRLKYEKWRNSKKIKVAPYDGTEDVVNLETGLKKLKNCSSVNEIVSEFTAVIKRLKHVEFDKLQKSDVRPQAVEMDDLIRAINELRTESKPKIKEEGKSTTDGFTNVNLVETWSKIYNQKLKMLQSVINATKDIMKVNNKQMVMRRKKTKQVLDKIKLLDITKISLNETVEALQEGIKELGKLKTDWTKLIDFYSKLSIFITKATEEITAFIEIARVIESKVNSLDNDEIFDNLLEKVEKANEASFLIHGVSDMYVNVSEKYILGQIATLDSMMSIDANKVDLKEFQNQLIKNTESDSEGILRFIEADETSLREKLVDRKNQIMEEYEWMLDCIIPEDGK